MHLGEPAGDYCSCGGGTSAVTVAKDNRKLNINWRDGWKCGKMGRELPPICSDVRQKQRISIDTLPPELKAPFPSDPVIPLRTKTTREFQEDMERAVQSGDWREVREFYLTTFDSFIEINAAFKREANGSFNTIDDSGVNAKFVNAVYDALLSTPQDIQKSVLKGIINSLLREWKGPRTKDDLRAYFILVQ
ncbi:probable E3 ubiquitin-protein ligase HECTD2, partial [Centroberyx affinis]|uniref:probable E3 ubiquitin-protein ligase HECTD2 n=1 Tax=Centroberyx affinis TaxID=166261 RepID=UPI003A5BE5D5